MPFTSPLVFSPQRYWHLQATILNVSKFIWHSERPWHKSKPCWLHVGYDNFCMFYGTSNISTYMVFDDVYNLVIFAHYLGFCSWLFCEYWPLEDYPFLGICSRIQTLQRNIYHSLLSHILDYFAALCKFKCSFVWNFLYRQSVLHQKAISSCCCTPKITLQHYVFCYSPAWCQTR